jgi:stage II sporulation protein AA (anti-sigma F factor antagonist)
MFVVHGHPSDRDFDIFDGSEMVDIGSTLVDEIAVITVAGELDISNADRLSDCIHDAISAGAKEIVVDIEHLTYLDSSGLSILLKAHQRMQRMGGSMVVFSPTPNVARLLDVTAVGLFLNIRSDSD